MSDNGRQEDSLFWWVKWDQMVLAIYKESGVVRRERVMDVGVHARTGQWTINSGRWLANFVREDRRLCASTSLSLLFYTTNKP